MNSQMQTVDTNNRNVIPNVATKIKNLSATKQVYLKLIIQMFPFLNNLLLCEYANQLIILLQNLINIQKCPTLAEFETGLISVLITYIFDIHQLIDGHLDLEQYETRHKNLTIINARITAYATYYDKQGIDDLKKTLLLV
jgi:hypothetical protein